VGWPQAHDCPPLSPDRALSTVSMMNPLRVWFLFLAADFHLSAISTLGRYTKTARSLMSAVLLRGMEDRKGGTPSNTLEVGSSGGAQGALQK